MPKRQHHSGCSDAARAEVERELTRQRKRCREHEDAARKLFRRVAREMISDRLLTAVAAGEVGRARDAVRVAPSARALPLLKSVQAAAWKQGREQGLERAKSIGSETFDERPTPARIRRLAERERRRAAFAAEGVENSQARRQARELLRTFRSALREQIGQEVSSAKAARNPDAALADARTLLERIRRGDTVSPEAQALLRGADQQMRDTLATPILEVDWEVSQRAEIAGWRAAEVVILAEFGAVLDDATTPVCRFLEGGTLPADHPEVDDKQPLLHYG